MAPFLGAVTSVDPKLIKDYHSADNRNANLEDGKITPRYGFRNLDGITTNFASLHGIWYIQGYDSNNALIEEYLSFERLSTHTSGKGKVYSRAVSNMAETEITNGGTPVEITNTSDMVAQAWQSDAYLVFPANTTTLYKHTIGTATSLTAMAVPADPTTALTYTLDFTGSGGSAYNQLSWAGLDPTLSGELATTGLASNSGATLNSDNSFTIRHSAGSGPGDASFEVDFDDITAGDQDWTYNDAFAFTLTENAGGAFTIDPATIAVSVTNEDGSPITFNLDTIAERVGSSNVIRVWAYARQPKARSSWDNIGTLKVSYKVVTRSGTISNNTLTMSKVWIGCTLPAPPSQRLPGEKVSFGYSYYFSTPSLESGIAGVLDIPLPQLEGYDPHGAGIHKLGAFIKFTSAASGDANVDKARFYWYDDRTPQGTTQDPFVWRRIVEQDDATTTYTLKMSYEELIALTAHSNKTGFATSNLIGLFPFKGSMVWLYKGGYQNIRISRTGDPLSQSSVLDVEEDLNRGATFSLADNFGDEPLGVGFQVGDAAIIPGSQGMYATVMVDRPYSATPPKKLPGSFGCPNLYACCRWKDEAGNPCVIAMAKNGEGIYEYSVRDNFNGEQGFSIRELSKKVRNSIKDFLLAADAGAYTPTLAEVRIGVDDARDALFVIAGKRAMVLRRPNIISGEREWEFYEWTTGGPSVTISRIAFSTKQRMRWQRSNGKSDENEYNSSTGSYITGTSRDDGSPIEVLPYWTSKEYSGPNRRIRHIFVDVASGTPTIQVISDRQTSSQTLASGKKFVKFGALQQGWNHQIKITLTENGGAVERIERYETPLGQRIRTS